MVPIAPSSGSKSRKLVRMAPSKETNGLAAASTSETGATTARKASASNTTSKVTNTKACGLLINATDKALTGAWKARNLDVSTLVTGMRIKSTAVALSSTRMVTVTTATGLVACPKVRVA